jgi:hypothetical protein
MNVHSKGNSTKLNTAIYKLNSSNRKAAKLVFQVIHVPGSYTHQTASGENSETEVRHPSQSIQVELGKLRVP